MKDVKSIKSKTKEVCEMCECEETTFRKGLVCCAECGCLQFKVKSINSAPKGCGKEGIFEGMKFHCNGILLCPDCKKLNEQKGDEE